ncbi:transposase [Pseudomonas otitidis]|uniref:transposase n=1 Tax=Metapseudomonas otitidis TaxID=319939 RepID=UPI002E7BCC40|nr:transposase [Pseudomonas otitidis]MEE1891361.1 transposase [Pseudomonas otitidis]
MIAGAQIIAPEGCLCFEKDENYFFLRSDSVSNRVLLVQFLDDQKGIRSELITISSFEFEESLEAGLLVEVMPSRKFPPWLEPIQGISVAELESRRLSSKKSYEQRVNDRYFAISELVRQEADILALSDPDAAINAHAKSLRPQQNALRLRLWFYTYVVFGHDKWSLMPPLHRVGSWNRDNPSQARKLGRPHKRGKYYGYRCDPEMQQKILKGYLRYRSPYKTTNQVYSEILTKEFGCTSVKRAGYFEFNHPSGNPFPSFPQIKYWINKLVSQKSRAVYTRGKNKARTQSGPMGSFSERLVNINQLVEFDGYYISEKLTGLTEGSAVDSFCVVRAVCVLSGAIVGIGFAEGKENRAAYEMCLFSMAVNKAKFCELFGVTIKPEEWPCEGLAGNIVFDRGPGSTYEDESQVNWLGALETAPVYSGQSKASVESSHPRDKKNLDQPSYFHSSLDFVLMARREILQVISDNATSDASGRMEESMYLAGVKPTPIGIWNYWDLRGRNSGRGMLFETAARSFLSVHPVVIKPDGVYLYGRKYRSPALVATGVFDRVARDGVIQAQASVLTMCVRHIWLDIDGVLYELDAIRTHRTLDGDIDISLRDLQEIHRIRLDSAAALRDERPAAQQHFRDRFTQETGEDGTGGERRTGRPAKSGSAQRDAADYNAFRGKVK